MRPSESTRAAPRFLEQQQRQQADIFSAIRHQLIQHARQTDGFAAQFRAHRRITFVEDQINRGSHAVQPLAQLVRRWDLIRNSRARDLAFRPYQPLRERRFGDQERARDLRRTQSA